MTERSRPTSLLTAPQQRHTTSPQSGGPPRVGLNGSQHGSQHNNSTVQNLMMKSPAVAKRKAAQREENRSATTMCLIITLTACILLSYREGLPLYSARIPPPHARPPQRHRRKRIKQPPAAVLQQVVELKNHTVTSVLEPTVWDPMPCDVLIETLKTKSIQLVALDFDKTIVDIHTGGRWDESPKSLGDHVRPSFQCLISHCLQEQIPVAVTTFSKQTELIQLVLKGSLRHYADKKGKPLDDTSFVDIPVFGGDDWVEGHTDGKQSQLLLARSYFDDAITHPEQQQQIIPSETDKQQKQEEEQQQQTNRISIKPEFTLLVDDDPNNIEFAIEDGYQTILYPAGKRRNRHRTRGGTKQRGDTKRYERKSESEEKAGEAEEQVKE